MVERERNRGGDEHDFPEGKTALPWAVMLFDFVVFLLFSLHVPATQQTGPGSLCGIGVSLFALLGRGGSCFPAAATRVVAAAPLPDGGWLLQQLPYTQEWLQAMGWERRAHTSPVAISTFPGQFWLCFSSL